VSLPDAYAEKFLVNLLLWEGGPESSRPSAAISAATKVRKTTRELVLTTPIIADSSLSWLRNAISSIEVTSDCSAEYFDLLHKLVSNEGLNKGLKDAPREEMAALATAVCRKLASCPRPLSETLAVLDHSTGVLCGCLLLLRALIERAGGEILLDGTRLLLKEFLVTPWSESTTFESTPGPGDVPLIDLMGVIFDAFLSPGGATSVVSICCDKVSRQRGFEVVLSAARHCQGGNGNGYMALVAKINGLVSAASPYLKHRWGQTGGGNDGSSRNGRNTSKYSGLRNQGCTCYMNSLLQQLFMTPELRKSLCSAPLPASVRASGGFVSARGNDLVGRKVAMQWENGASYDAMVEAFNSTTGMHRIRYFPLPVATVGAGNHQQIRPEDIERLPPVMPDEFFLSEGRPGKETGVFEVVAPEGAKENGITDAAKDKSEKEVEETEDEAASRHLMEEVQRTFIHLEEGSRGRFFDPRALVEACACLKLEFDVWQQNDASEFATKLLDRLETSLKRWAPEHFHYLDHTFGLKQTKQKICKECGLKVSIYLPDFLLYGFHF
jgi:ubiquitin carboxyl-terminal hydrolase 9/24